MNNNTFKEVYNMSKPDNYDLTIHNCPFCGTKLYKNHKKMNWDKNKKKHIDPPENVKLFLKEIEDVFKKYNLHATWACVVMAAFENLESLKAAMPQLKHSYIDSGLSSYRHIEDG